MSSGVRFTGPGPSLGGTLRSVIFIGQLSIWVDNPWPPTFSKGECIVNERQWEVFCLWMADQTTLLQDIKEALRAIKVKLST
jgi:hypothetical protein